MRRIAVDTQVTPDINVLVAAFRKDHSHHVVARAWLRDAVAGGEGALPLRLLPVAIAGFLRLVTNAKVFVQPDSIQDAVAFVDALLASAGIEMAAPGDEWLLLRRLCLDGQLRGNAIPDAWLAAAVMRLGEHLVTFDAGFRKLLGRDRLTVLAA